MTHGRRVAVDLLEPGWSLRVLADDPLRGEEWLEIALVLHTQRAGLPNRVWVYFQDRAKPMIFDSETVVHAIESVIK